MIHAIVRIATAENVAYTFNAVGFSAAAIDASARDLFGDEPVGVTVMVLA